MTNKDSNYVSYYINNKRYSVSKEKPSKPLTNEQYLSILRNEEYQEFLKTLTFEGIKKTGGYIQNILDIEKDTPIKTIKVNDIKMVRKKIVQAAIQKYIQEKSDKKEFIKGVKTADPSKFNTRGMSQLIINAVGNLESNNINNHLKSIFQRHGTEGMPFYFKYNLRRQKLRKESTLYNNYYEIFLILDYDYINFINSGKIDFATFLAEKGEHELSSIVFKISPTLGAYNVNTWKQIKMNLPESSSFSSTMSSQEETKLRRLFFEFIDAKKKNPEKYTISKTLPPMTYENKDKVVKFNYAGKAVIKVAAIQDSQASNVGYQKTEYTEKNTLQRQLDFASDTLDPDTNRNIRKFQVKEPEKFIKENLQKRRLLMQDKGSTEVLKWLTSEGMIMSEAASPKIPVTYLKMSEPAIQAAVLEAIDMLYENLSQYSDRVMASRIKSRSKKTMTVADLLNERAKGMGIKEGTDVSEQVFNIPKEQREQWKVVKSIKFPNIDAILFWWIRSGQFKMTSEKFKKRWESVKNYNTEAKMGFLNSMVYFIASGVYMKKVQEAINDGIPFTTNGMRTSGVRRSSAYGINRRNKERNKAQAERYEKYAEWRQNLRQVRSNMNATKEGKQKYTSSEKTFKRSDYFDRRIGTVRKKYKRNR